MEGMETYIRYDVKYSAVTFLDAGHEFLVIVFQVDDLGADYTD